MNISETDGALMSDVKPVAWQRFDELGEYDTYMGLVEEGDYVKYDDALAIVTALQAEIVALRPYAALGRAVYPYFKSGNATPVERATIRRGDIWEELDAAMAIFDAAIAKEKQQESLK